MDLEAKFFPFILKSGFIRYVKFCEITSFGASQNEAYEDNLNVVETIHGQTIYTPECISSIDERITHFMQTGVIVLPKDISVTMPSSLNED